jgi:hypothetical protein
MERCVGSARGCDVFTDFHVLTDRPIPECECYDAFTVEKESGLFQFYYLKLGMTKLNYDYFIWLDADTLFVRNPLNILDALGHSPIHVPLEFNLEGVEQDHCWNGMSLHAARAALKREGILNSPWFCENAFWMIHRDAIEPVYDLAVGFYHKAKEAGDMLHISTALGYAMQILCADPERHLLTRSPRLWATRAGDPPEPGASWSWRSRALPGQELCSVRPAILHNPCQGDLSRTGPLAREWRRRQ